MTNIASQRKLHSLIEAWVNVLVGFGIAVTTQVIVFPWFGLHTSLGNNFFIGGIFTIVSIIRSYILRRAFNHWHVILVRSQKL